MFTFIFKRNEYMIWKYSIDSTSQYNENYIHQTYHSLVGLMNFPEITRNSLRSEMAKLLVFNGD